MSPADPRTAVVIATRNRAACLGFALARLLALPERPRIVVVDNGSSDGTPAIVRAGFSTVEVVSLPANRGAAARNVGVERVMAPYVAFADDDSWYAPGALATAANLLDRHPRLGLIAARVLVGPDETIDPTCAVMAASPLRATDLPGPAVLGFLACGAVVRRAAFLAAGGFSGRFGVGGEEELLAIDLAAAGWSLAYIPSVVAHHHPPLRPASADRRRVQARNALWSAWLRRRPAGALRRTLRLVRPALRDPVTRAGVVAALGGLVHVVRDRRPVPAWLERDLRRLDGGLQLHANSSCVSPRRRC
ncbi:MAG TPA: glycosyltransferase [Gemmataceae bacterium]|jgi:GT2 family glycosyltransferase